MAQYFTGVATHVRLAWEPRFALVLAYFLQLQTFQYRARYERLVGCGLLSVQGFNL